MWCVGIYVSPVVYVELYLQISVVPLVDIYPNYSPIAITVYLCLVVPALGARSIRCADTRKHMCFFWVPYMFFLPIFN